MTDILSYPRNCFLCQKSVSASDSKVYHILGLSSAQIGFGICVGCQMIIQTPALPPKEMEYYYREIASYSNEGRNSKVSKNKELDVSRQVHVAKLHIHPFPSSIFQVGCSDGYTLSQFQKAGASEVSGIDPNDNARELAKSLYDIDVISGIFENFYTTKKFDCIVLTHVLEHLYHPETALKKCYEMQNENSHILIEVPLFERPDRFPPGMLTIEHLNYFSENTLLALLKAGGYNPIQIEKLYYNNLYPVIMVIAKKEKNFFAAQNNSNYQIEIFQEYIQTEQKRWDDIYSVVKKNIPLTSDVYIWGSGIHTSQLFAFTSIQKDYHIVALIDSNQKKWEKKLFEYLCCSVNDIHWKKNDTIIISSFASENEIYQSIKYLKDQGINVIRLYQRDTL